MIKRIALIAPLGGEPVTQPRAVPHDNQPGEILEHAPAAEQQRITDYDQLVRQSEAFGDIGLKVSLEIRLRTRPWNLQR